LTVPRGRPFRVAIVLAAVCAAIPSAAAGAAENVKYTGETEDGRVVKLVANARGTVLRGSITLTTECTGGFDPFRARVDLRPPLDRSGPRGFRDKGGFLEEDDRFSAHYKYKVKAERESERVLAGEISLEIVFRRNDVEYTTCTAERVVFGAKRPAGD
jgi:hypothetical protein